MKLVYRGEWTNELDNLFFEKMRGYLLNNFSVDDSVRKVAKELDTTITIVKNRWYVGNRYRKPLKALLTNEENATIKSLIDNRKRPKHLFKRKVEKVETVPEVKKEESTSEILNKLYQEIISLKDSNKEIVSSLNTLVQDQDMIKFELIKLKKEIQQHNEIINDTYGEKIDLLQQKSENLTNKLKSKTSELRKKDAYISKYIVSNVMEDNSKTKMIMERNGNLISVN